MTDQELIERLLFLAETAVDQALDLNYDDPEDYFIYRELRELKAVVAAQPEPQGPTDDELAFLYYVHCGGSDAMGQVGFEDAARAVLARYGRPAIEPVPTSERLPGPEDCDAEGHCWLFRVALDGVGDWHQKRPHPSAESSQFFRETHWLPHWALPVPALANTINQNNY